jgi:hypothetical protein
MMGFIPPLPPFMCNIRWLKSSQSIDFKAQFKKHRYHSTSRYGIKLHGLCGKGWLNNPYIILSFYALKYSQGVPMSCRHSHSVNFILFMIGGR